MDKKTSLKIEGANGRQLAGTAAVLHYFSAHGGFDRCMRNLLMNTSHTVAEQVTEALLAQLPELARAAAQSAEDVSFDHTLFGPNGQRLAATQKVNHVQ